MAEAERDESARAEDVGEGDVPAAAGEVDYEAFLTAFARNRDRLYAFVFSLLPNHADAEDVFQRCSLVLWRKFAAFDPTRNFLSWACGIAANEVRSTLRTRRRDRLRFDDELVGQLAAVRERQVAEFDERFEALQGCVEALKPEDRELIRRAYDPERRLEEYAAATGKALQTLYNRLARLRRALYDCVRRKRPAGEGCS